MMNHETESQPRGRTARVLPRVLASLALVCSGAIFTLAYAAVRDHNSNNPLLLMEIFDKPRTHWIFGADCVGHLTATVARSKFLVRDERDTKSEDDLTSIRLQGLVVVRFDQQFVPVNISLAVEFDPVLAFHSASGKLTLAQLESSLEIPRQSPLGNLSIRAGEIQRNLPVKAPSELRLVTGSERSVGLLLPSSIQDDILKAAGTSFPQAREVDAAELAQCKSKLSNGLYPDPSAVPDIQQILARFGISLDPSIKGYLLQGA